MTFQFQEFYPVRLVNEDIRLWVFSFIIDLFPSPTGTRIFPEILGPLSVGPMEIRVVVLTMEQVKDEV